MIETERLIIDRLVKEDKKDYFDNISHNKKVLETFICQYCESLDSFDFDKYLNKDSIYAIRLKENNKLIGILTIFNDKKNYLEIGYGIGDKYWNKGYTSEAVKAFLPYLFSTYSIDYIVASYFIDNLASKRVMEKCNMKYDHINKNELVYLDKPRDLVYYKIKRDDL